MKPIFYAFFILLAMQFPAYAEVSFFPKPEVVKSVDPRAEVMERANQVSRQYLADFINIETSKKPYPPKISAKVLGDEAETLLITAHEDEFINTVYRAEAAMSRFTSLVRTMPIFTENDMSPYIIFTDMLYMMGFKVLVLSDGKEFSYQINIKEDE